MSYAARDPRRRGWWSYMKWCIRKYDSVIPAVAKTELERKELEAVRSAVEKTAVMSSGQERIDLVQMVFWTRSHNVPGAAMALHVSERTALRWHSDFIKLVAAEFFGADLLKEVSEEEKHENKKFR